MFSDPELLRRVEELEVEAKRLSGDSTMGMMRPLRYLAACGHVAAQGLLNALDCAQTDGPERRRLIRRARSRLIVVR